MEEQIKANAELVIAQMRPLSGFAFGYDAQSVAWLDGYIERERAGKVAVLSGRPGWSMSSARI